MPKGTDYKGKKKKRIMRTLKVNEISGVDRPAQVGAREVLMKRDNTEPLKKVMRLTSNEKGHSHLLDDSQEGDHTSWTTSEGSEFSHSHPYVVLGDGTIVIGESEGHGHKVILRKKSVEVKKFEKEQAEARTASVTQKLATGDELGGGTETGMPEGNDPAVVEKSLEDATKKNAELEKRLVRSESIGKLGAAERVHFDALDSGGQDEFLKMDESKRASVLKNAADSNPVTYTSEAGAEFRKNDDPRLVEMAKREDISAKKLQKQEDTITRARLEKRAGDELPNLPGDADVKVAVLKAVESISDEKLREGAEALLKSGNDAIKGAFKRNGTTADDSVSGDDAIQKIAKSLQDKDATLTEAQAYNKALETPEGLKAYTEMREAVTA